MTTSRRRQDVPDPTVAGSIPAPESISPAPEGPETTIPTTLSLNDLRRLYPELETRVATIEAQMLEDRVAAIEAQMKLLAELKAIGPLVHLEELALWAGGLLSGKGSAVPLDRALKLAKVSLTEQEVEGLRLAYEEGLGWGPVGTRLGMTEDEARTFVLGVLSKCAQGV